VSFREKNILMRAVPLYFLFSLIGISRVSFAQVTQVFLERSQEDILSQEEQRRRDYILDLQHQSPSKKVTSAIKEELEKDSSGESKFLHFKAIKLEGSTVFSAMRLRRMTDPYLHKAISLEDIDRLIRVITNLYIEAGYTTSRVYLPEQSLSSGILRLKILESKRGVLEILEEGQKREKFNTVFPSKKGSIFNLRDYEQGLDQINRLKSYNATIDLKPGEAEGETAVSVLTEVKKPSKTSLRVETNNGGSRATGMQQQIFNVSVDDFFDLYDSVGLTVRHDLGLNHSGKKNRGVSGNITVPYRYWNFRLVGDYYEYLQTIRRGPQSFKLTGQNHSYMGEIERIIHRDHVSKTGVGVSITQKTAKNFVNGTRILTNSRKLTVGSGRVFHTRRLWGGALSASSQFDQGLKLLGAQKDKASPPGSPKAQFKKVQAYASYYKPFTIKDQQFSWQISGNGMWSKDLLFSSEKQSIGGQHTVRGYWDQSLSGNVGGYIRNELAWQLPPISGAPINYLVENSELYVGFDAGWIKGNASSKDDSGHLRGMGAGLRTRAEHFFAEIGFEKAFSKPDTFSKPEQRVFLKLGFEF